MAPRLKLTRSLCLALGLVLVLGTGRSSLTEAKITDEAEAKKFLEDLDLRYIEEANAQMEARWKYITDVTDANAQAQIAANIKFQNFQLEAWKNVTQFDWSNFQDLTTKREFTYLNILGPAALEAADLEQYNQLAAEMESIYSSATICPFNDPNGQNCNLALDPELTEIMATSDNYDELQHAWVQWREKSGRPVRQKYIDFVALNNKAADKSGYPDMGSLWNAYYLYEGYTEDQFKAEIEQLWQTVKPLYLEMYTYVRRLMYQKYPGRFQRYGRMPAHILGNMWAQSWGNIARDVLPFNDTEPVDATPGLVAGGYTPEKMFRLSESFFVGLGFENMTDIFWEKSLIEKPDDRVVVCHASAEDFFIDKESKNRTDFRIKMCTTINQEDLITVHHEMGHIAYFMQYRDQHWVFRNGANPGFHEAIGDCLALAVATPAHLENVGLLDPSKAGKGTPRFKDLPDLPEGVTPRDMNYLLSQALEKISFIPFGYLMDKWRWGVFSGTTTNENLNQAWWDLRRELQGLIPPVERSENDFDPGAKYHIPANVEYIRYFVSYIVQFQFYESLCKAAEKYDPSKLSSEPLYKCDFANSPEAGRKLIDMMAPGFSKPWPDALEAATGSRGMDASSIMKYFEPLYNWLKEVNQQERDCVGWGADCEDEAKDFMETEYEKKSSEYCHYSNIAYWNYETNLTTDNAENSTKWSLQAANYRKQSWEERIKQYEFEEFQDESLKRQFRLLITLGTAALPEDKLGNLSSTVNRMSDQFSSSRVCPYDKQECDLATEGLLLDPDLEDILVKSKDYDELAYVWKAWRDAASKRMRPDYKIYVELSNEAAKANNLPDMSELWVGPYENPSFENDTEALLKQMEPFYKDLHAYVRMKLRGVYKEKIDADTPIPASLLGNMWAQTWENLYDITAPYPEAGTVDVTEELINQGYNATRMFRTSEEFYTSLGLAPMPTTYGERSMIVRPEGRDVVCHASAWDFCNGEDFRIKMCTNVDMVDLITIHHEMGHIQYDIQYKDQPITFRDGANPGFHEAIGDTLALSVSTPKHLNKIGLLNITASRESDLNFLMRTALEKVVFLPFAFVMDKWRWGVFRGEYPESEWNYHWWKLREEYQGLMAPVVRSENDFDPGAKFHIAADVEYSRYFVAHILQFQFHKALCLAAGEYVPNDSEKPLYRCDIYGNSEAGQKLKTLLQAGSSKPWREILKEVTGDDNLDSSAITEYFEPLHAYIKDKLRENNEVVGWRSRVDEMFDDGNVDQTVPIVVGVILGVLVVVVVVAYFVGDARRRKKQKKNQHHQDPERRSSD